MDPNCVSGRWKFICSDGRWFKLFTNICGRDLKFFTGIIFKITFPFFFFLIKGTLVPRNVIVVQSLIHIQLVATPWTVAHQPSLSFTVSQSLLKLMSIELMMPSNHLILCYSLLLLPLIFPNRRVFSNESTLHIRWPKY